MAAQSVLVPQMPKSMYIDFWLISDMTNIGFDQYPYCRIQGFILVESPDSPEVGSVMLCILDLHCIGNGTASLVLRGGVGVDA